MEAGKSEKEVDLYRDTPVRLLGYANEVGESFRSLVPVRVVHLSYIIASGYAGADTVDKVIKAHKVLDKDSKDRNKKLLQTAFDTLVWQGLASVIIPGYTINRACALSLFLLKKKTKLPLVMQRWITTAVGLGCIPFIVKPIDWSVDFMMDNTLRRWIPLHHVHHEECAH